MAFFEGNKMTAGYGDGPDIITSCSINVNKGEIVAILGPNGAGKSTAMKAMLGLLNLKSGSVSIDGNNISSLSPQDRVKQGISFVPQTRNVFAELTVKENLEIGAFLRKDDINQVIDEIYELFPILEQFLNRKGGDLSGGQQQQLAIARALLGKPKLLLLDEPTEGIQPSIILDIERAVQRIIKETGISVLLVEQHLHFVKQSSFYYAMQRGGIVSSGLTSNLSDAVIKEFLTV